MRARVRLVVTLVCALAAAPALAQSFNETNETSSTVIMRVHVRDRGKQIPLLADMQLDIAGVDVKTDNVDVVGDSEIFQMLKNAGFEPEIVWSSISQTAVAALSQYLDPTEVSAKLDTYVSNYPALAKKISIATTAQGRSEWALKISSNVNVEEDKPVVLYVGQHHAREVMTTEIAFDIIDYLLTRYATDPQVQAWVNGREIWVVPSHNPDGTNTVFTSNSQWRKNRRNNGDSTFGVDPNRNYPFHWNFCNDGQGASSSTSNDTYRGPSAGSEPETQGLMQLARDQRPVVSLSYHTYSELVIHPYGCVENIANERRLLRDYSSDMAARTRNDGNDGWYSNGTSYELLYEVSGDSDTWLYGELGILATTIEANSGAQGFQPDYTTWRDQTVLRNRGAWQYLLDRIDGSSVWGHTTDACTGAPLSATIGLDEINFTNGETPRTSEPGFGRYHRLTLPGSYHVRVTKPGYATAVWPVEVGLKAAQREVRLVPTGSFAVEPLSWTIQDGSGDMDGLVDPGEAVTMSVRAVATGGAVSGVSAVLSTSDPYVTITDPNASWPAIAAGGTAVSTGTFGFSVSPSAPEGHLVTFTLAWSASQSLCGSTSTFQVPVTARAMACPAFSVPLDTNPGWTIQNSDASGWAFGAAASGGVGGPSSAHSGSNVYGTNLTGNYADGGDYKLITTPFNLTEIHGAELRFWRWLDNEPGYDIASVDISTDGINFTPVWSGFGRDTDWQLYRFDISAIADDQPTVYVRFRLQSDSATNDAGFYIDDVSICGAMDAPAPRLNVASWTVNDGVNGTCSDHDAYADGGEAVDLTVNVRNDGPAAAVGSVAQLSTTDPRIDLATFRVSLGTVAPGATAPATFRVVIPSGIACKTSVPFRVDLASNAGAFTNSYTSLSLTVNADDGTAVPDTLETFDPTASGWTLGSEWQIAQPQGKGGSANGASGSPDPTSAYSGTKVLGLDLTGTGSQIGSYENNLTTATVATSPVYDCSHSTNVQVQFKRWLGVESSNYDKATMDVYNGTTWVTIWQNPSVDMSDSSWQSVSYDVTPQAAGNAAFRVRFKMTSDSAVVYCGWNIDDLRITNGYTPQLCEGTPCSAGCTPAAALQGLSMTKAGGGVEVATWSPGMDPCQSQLGANYRVYRSSDPRPRTIPPTQWPQSSYFTDVTAADLDGSASNTSYSDTADPPPGGVFYYLVVPIGTSGLEGPKGWQGF